jgi:sigma-54 dependent transcriptional regulator, acetoin dehydrogenase operon transcriptional activator AcoR
VPLGRAETREAAMRFFQLAARDLGRLSVSVEPAVYAAFEAYHWPGGERELKHVVRRIMQTSVGTIRLRDLPHMIREAYDGPSNLAPSAIDSEDARLIQVVRESRTMSEAADQLGITRSTLYRRMERFGLKPRRVVGHE